MYAPRRRNQRDRCHSTNCRKNLNKRKKYKHAPRGPGVKKTIAAGEERDRMLLTQVRRNTIADSATF